MIVALSGLFSYPFSEENLVMDQKKERLNQIKINDQLEDVMLRSRSQEKVKEKSRETISLLNVIYKLASTVISNRLKHIMQELIHDDKKVS